MRIVADENISFVEEAFGAIGDLMVMPGRNINPQILRTADVLLVRSVTTVDENLLAGSDLSFIGTATIGEDHIDKRLLETLGITYANAPGSNANSVAEYVITAMLELAQERGFELGARRLGIIGVGHVGSRVRQLAEALGMECVLNDPPLADVTGDEAYRPIDEALACDIITFHVPLTEEGRYATHHMVDAKLIERMKVGAIVINTSRGPVIESEALRKALEDGHLGATALDVWEHEPNIDTDLMANAAIATPHIAGYSIDGKAAATKLMFDAVCERFDIDATWEPSDVLPKPKPSTITIEGNGETVIGQAVSAAYDIYRDDAPFRKIATMSEDERGAYFDSLRKDYSTRWEFPNYTVNVPADLTEAKDKLFALGFNVDEA